MSLPSLTQLSATDLAALLASRDVSSEEVTKAHLDRIEAIDPTLKAFTQVLRHEALAAARRSDEERRRGDVRGPLHGLPVSIKESLDMAGQASTLGTPARKGHRAVEDAAIVALMRRAGCIVLGRTNVSQLLLFHESRNPLFGQTANPWNLDRTPGGSSGGEACAIASGMSPLGVGTDIGGSIRIPAHFCGIAGLKPTLDRWTNKGGNTALLGQEAVRSQLGPMARTARDLALAMTALDPGSMSALDERVVPMPVPDPTTVDVGKLRVGYYTDDGLVAPSKAVARAVAKAASVLHACGAAVMPFTPPGIVDAIYTYFAALSADGGRGVASILEGGDVDISLRLLRRLATLPPAARQVAASVASMVGEQRLNRMIASIGEKTVSELWQLTHALRVARAAIFSAMRAEQLDILLCPAHATVALPHTASRDFSLAGSSSMLWNLAQFPSGVVAVTRVGAHETTREAVRDRLDKRALQVDRQSAGLPVGVQVVGLPYQEEIVLGAMMAIEDGLKNEPDYPKTPYFA